MEPSSLVVIGASYGGVEATMRLVSELDPNSPAAWCMALHLDAHRSDMPVLLERCGRLPAAAAQQGERLRSGHIYLPAPDQHLLIEDGHVVLSHGPREHWVRPAIDPLFRSAAQHHGSQVIGVILTGYLNDGTHGLLEVKRRGGTAVVQDPREAVAPDMPASALRHVAVDHCLPLEDMAALLTKLVGGATPRPLRKVGGNARAIRT